MISRPPPAPPGPPASLPPPPRRFGRRLNHNLAIIGVLITCIIMAAFAYTLHQRSIEEQRRRELAQATPAGADASGILKGAPSGYITPADAAPTTLNPMEASTGPAAAAKNEEAPDDNGREKARKDAWVKYWADYAEVRKDRGDNRKKALGDLKTSVEGSANQSSHSAGEAPGAAAPAATPVSTAAGGQGGWGGGGGWGNGFSGFGGLGPAPQIDKESQEQKITFAGQAGDLGKNDVVPTMRKPPDPYAVTAGSFVKFTTINEVNSDVPGSQIGMVTESVYNTSTGNCVLIPQGTRLIGRYNSVVGAGQSRLPGVLTRLIFPDGSSQAIGAMESADNAGSAGQEDQINRHLIQKFGSAFVAGLFGAAIQLSVPQNGISNGYNSTQIIGASLGQQMGQLGQQIAQQNLSIPNTITIRAGYNGTMITDKDIHITPWSCDGGTRHSAMPIMSVNE